MVVVIGAGPAGLATAAELRRNGVRARVLERGERVGTSWRAHYDRLHLNTVRWLSGLPRMPIPARMGRWVARDDFIAYLERYTVRNELDVETGTEVRGLERNGASWRIRTATGTIGAAAVVVATGFNRDGYVPDWPGADRFRGSLIHSRAYRNAEPYRGRNVLVAGLGSSGAEIAADLVQGGAAAVYVAVRRGPTILGREVFGVPTQLLGALAAGLPPRLVDRAALLLQRFAFGDLRRHGIPPPARGFVAELLDGRLPVIDTGFCRELTAGRIEAVSAVERFDGAHVVLVGERRLPVDAVIAATGFRRGLEPLAGELGVLRPDGTPVVSGPRTSPHAPGLYFIGLANDIEGSLFEIARDATKIARTIAASHGAAAATRDSGIASLAAPA